jgi:sugar fermentation stimulation protein A
MVADEAAGAVAAARGANRLYVVAAWVPRREEIGVGSLGRVTFARGWYAYVGSARRGRDARVARHRRADKPLRWHADHLFARHPATRAWLIDTDLTECELARLVRKGAGKVADEGWAAGFGAGDCGCEGHLVAVRRLEALAAAVAPLTR